MEKVFYNTEPGHNKFWAISLPGLQYSGPHQQWVVTVRWGPIGSKGQSQLKTFRTLQMADHFVLEKCSEKLNKGYEFAKPPHEDVAESAKKALADAVKESGLPIELPSEPMQTSGWALLDKKPGQPRMVTIPVKTRQKQVAQPSEADDLAFIDIIDL
jgi:predicted DNA-binding WGR domain protein